MPGDDKKTKIAFIAPESGEGRKACDLLAGKYGQHAPEDADYLVVLGGDGTMLEALHDHTHLDRPFYGMNRGSVGFLLNPWCVENLPGRLKVAHSITIHPLRAAITCADGSRHDLLAYNEVSLFRQTRYAAKIGVYVDSVERVEEMISDGILLSTPAGSTAYNLSAHGPILPLGANVLALTPINAFRPRHWRGAVLPRECKVRLEVHDPATRPVSTTADFTEIRDVIKVDIRESRAISRTLLFDPDHSLEERILKEQFLP